MIPSLGSLSGRLRLRQLTLLIALDEHHSLHRAARAINMSQPAATKALNEIEDMIGATLFERSWRGIEPTLAGRCVIRYARIIQTDLANMHEEMSGILQGQGGHVALGSIMGPVPELLSRTIAKLRQQHPTMTVEWVVDTSVRLLDRLDRGQLDLVVGRIMPPHDEQLYDYRPLGAETLCIVSGPHHPLTKFKAVTLEATLDYPWAVLPRDAPLRGVVEEVFTGRNLPLPFMPVETHSMFATIALLQATDLLSAMAVEVARLFVTDGLIQILPVEPKTPLPPYGLIVRKDTSQSPAVQVFVGLLRGEVG